MGSKKQYIFCEYSGLTTIKLLHKVSLLPFQLLYKRRELYLGNEMTFFFPLGKRCFPACGKVSKGLKEGFDNTAIILT